MPPEQDRQSPNEGWQNPAEVEPSTSAPVSSSEPTTPLPTTPTSTAAPAGMSIASSRKSGRKKWLPAIISAVVLVLLLAGGSVAYALYQQPNNVLVGAFVNGVSSKSVTFRGTLSSTAKDSNDTSNPLGALRATFDGKSDGQQAALTATLGTKYNAKDVNVDFSTAVTSNSDLYFKFGKLTQVLSAVSDGDK